MGGLIDIRFQDCRLGLLDLSLVYLPQDVFTVEDTDGDDLAPILTDQKTEETMIDPLKPFALVIMLLKQFQVTSIRTN